ncbi:hypothetical protein ACSI5N_25190 (plasmid) [Raoultella ornithinolytica]|nr:hypothetical protein [Raoultella ornithinolytica]MDV1094921.1 hypothetical protein [Raoultella ornithinolytica]MDV1122735.1 hypothetical protein [Raoultella ornithinolytica]MDV1893250.1 hypothetical protein [Raoultella ornithinolytica]
MLLRETLLNFWEYADKNPGWILLFLLVVVYGVEQAIRAARKPKQKRRN